jgi:hypothetical protein
MCFRQEGKRGKNEGGKKGGTFWETNAFDPSCFFLQTPRRPAIHLPRLKKKKQKTKNEQSTTFPRFFPSPSLCPGPLIALFLFHYPPIPIFKLKLN